MPTTFSQLKKLFAKAETKQKKMHNCLYDLSSPAGVLYLDEQTTNEETGKPVYKRQIGQCNIHIEGIRFQGTHN